MYITGANIHNISGKCMFGTSPFSKLVFINSTTAYCITPPHASGRAMLNIRYEHLEAALPVAGGKMYTYEDTPYIAQIYPTHGCELGGTNVRVMGAFFKRVNTLVCSFNAGSIVSISPGFWVSPTVVECVTPKAVAGVAALAISNNQRIFSETIPFTFLSPFHLDHIYPTRGPYEGGSNVIIRTNRIAIWHEFVCRFDSTEVIGTKLNETAILCVSPRHSTGMVNVSVVTSTGYESINSILFEYVEAPRIISVLPKCGPVSGNTRLTIKGEGFRKNVDGESKCRFFGTKVLPAIVHDDKTMSCITPPATADIATDVEVTFNNFEYAPSTILYSFHKEIEIDACVPNVGSEYGGTAVIISGSNFLNVENISCKFGAIVVKAEWISMFLIRCISPQQIGSARLAVSNNGIDFSSSNVEFTYQPRMILESLSPTSATTLGGTLVSVSGTNLRSYGHPSCHFGDTHVVDAMVVSESLIKCITPRVQRGGSVKLYISHNGIDRSKYFLNFIVRYRL